MVMDTLSRVTGFIVFKDGDKIIEHGEGSNDFRVKSKLKQITL